MPEHSPTLSLPYLQPAQAQKHVTHNEALRILDAVTQLTVAAADTGEPPAAPQQGARYIVGPAATDDWQGQENAIAIFTDGAWQFFQPETGWRADVAASGETLRFDGTGWAPHGTLDLQDVDVVGVNATADSLNRLAVSSGATLFNHEGADHQLKINKAAATDTASVLFQTSYSGRVEMGTPGNDDFEIKVSTDGVAYKRAIKIDGGSGNVIVGEGAGSRNLSILGTLSPSLLVRNAGGTGGATLRLIDDAPAADWSFRTAVTGDIYLRDEANGRNVVTFQTADPARVSVAGPVKLAVYAVADLPAPGAAGQGSIVYVRDAAGGQQPAFSDGFSWRRMTDRTIVS